MICGTRGDPGTVAPFRAWRGSRDLVAQSPKFHAPALSLISCEYREKSSTAFTAQPEHAASASYNLFALILASVRDSRAQVKISVLPPLLPERPAAALPMDSPNSL